MEIFHKSGYPSRFTWKGATDEFRKNHLCSTLQVSAGTGNNFWMVIPPTGTPEAPNAALAEQIEREVDVPVICVGPGLNVMRYNKLDREIDEARRELDENRRQKMYYTIQKQLMEDFQPFLCL